MGFVKIAIKIDTAKYNIIADVVSDAEQSCLVK